MSFKNQIDFTRPICFTILDGSDVYGKVLTADQPLAEYLWDRLRPEVTFRNQSTPHISASYSIQCLYEAVIKAETAVGSTFQIDSALVFMGDTKLSVWLKYLQELGEHELTIDFPAKQPQ